MRGKVNKPYVQNLLKTGQSLEIPRKEYFGQQLDQLLKKNGFRELSYVEYHSSGREPILDVLRKEFPDGDFSENADDEYEFRVDKLSLLIIHASSRDNGVEQFYWEVKINELHKPRSWYSYSRGPYELSYSNSDIVEILRLCIKNLPVWTKKWEKLVSDAGKDNAVTKIGGATIEALVAARLKGTDIGYRIGKDLNNIIICFRLGGKQFMTVNISSKKFMEQLPLALEAAINLDSLVKTSTKLIRTGMLKNVSDNWTEPEPEEKE